MKAKDYRVFVPMVMILFLISGSISFAQGIKERMSARQPEIVAMKTAGIIGENNRGYLEFVGAQKQKEDIINAENADRDLIYKAIADREGISAEAVGQLRAKAIAENAITGEWLQNENGEWYQK